MGVAGEVVKPITALTVGAGLATGVGTAIGVAIGAGTVGVGAGVFGMQVASLIPVGPVMVPKEVLPVQELEVELQIVL